DEALLTFQDRTTIDVDRARAQHAAYVALLEGLGVEIVRAPPAPDHPDACFVEDTVVASASAPRTVAMLVARGLRVQVLAIDEFEKAEAGLTCLSVLLPR
ncbi:MAG: N(G),N(G)-dimethylarginine dimethylaminohydrolase, partial [Intrasporangiaceae bacterium]|nr:N(G),N(G)-dimethylarginine dimethylaminohydrolase [Intrasporangiaceae bacterium]